MRKISVLLLVVLACLSFVGCNRGKAGNTEAGTPFWNTPKEIAADATFFSSKLRFDGNLGLSYFSPSQKTIFYEEYNTEGTRLSSVKVLTGFADCQGLALGMSFCDRPIITFYNGADKKLYFLCHDNKSLPGWTTGPDWTIKVLDGRGDVGRVSVWDTIENSSMILTYIDSGTSKVRVICMGGGGNPWAETIPYDGTVDQYLSIAVRAKGGEPVIVFRDPKLGALVCAQRKAGVWTTEVVDKSGNTGYFCKVRTSTSGDIIVAYQDQTNADKPVTKVAIKTASNWTIETVDSAKSGYNLDLALDAGQRPHVLSTNGAQFKYAWTNGAAWETMTIQDPIGITGAISIHLPKSGMPVAFYTYQNKIGFVKALATE